MQSSVGDRQIGTGTAQVGVMPSGVGLEKRCYRLTRQAVPAAATPGALRTPQSSALPWRAQAQAGETLHPCDTWQPLPWPCVLLFCSLSMLPPRVSKAAQTSCLLTLMVFQVSQPSPCRHVSGGKEVCKPLS